MAASTKWVSALACGPAVATTLTPIWFPHPNRQAKIGANMAFPRRFALGFRPERSSRKTYRPFWRRREGCMTRRRTLALGALALGALALGALALGALVTELTMAPAVRAAGPEPRIAVFYVEAPPAKAAA